MDPTKTAPHSVHFRYAMYDVRPNAMYKHQLTQKYEDFLDCTDPEHGGSRPLRNAGTYQSSRHIPEHTNLPVHRCEKHTHFFFYVLHSKILLSSTIFYKFG
jgi:hypothetical protein